MGPDRLIHVLAPGGIEQQSDKKTQLRLNDVFAGSTHRLVAPAFPGQLVQRLKSPNPALFIGRGKAEQLRELLGQEEASLVITGMRRIGGGGFWSFFRNSGDQFLARRFGGFRGGMEVEY